MKKRADGRRSDGLSAETPHEGLDGQAAAAAGSSNPRQERTAVRAP